MPKRYSYNFSYRQTKKLMKLEDKYAHKQMEAQRKLAQEQKELNIFSNIISTVLGLFSSIF